MTSPQYETFEGDPQAMAKAWQIHLVGNQAEGTVYNPETGYYGDQTMLAGGSVEELTGSDGVVAGHGELGPQVRHLTPGQLAAPALANEISSPQIAANDDPTDLVRGGDITAIIGG